MIQLNHPALIDQSNEFFNIGTTKHRLSNGVLEVIEHLPAFLYNLIEIQIKGDKRAKLGLKKLGIIDQLEAIEKYYDCNYSAFDGNPDVDVFGNLGIREYVPCVNRGKCAAEGLLCQIPNGLSKKEVIVAIRIALGDTDAQTAYELDISTETLRKHKNNIERKIGRKGKVSIGVWAVKNNLI